MLDINALRNDLAGIAAALAKRGVTLDNARFETLEGERKRIQTRTQELQAKRNTLSKQVGIAKGKGEDVSPLLTEVGGVGEELKDLELAGSQVRGVGPRRRPGTAGDVTGAHLAQQPRDAPRIGPRADPLELRQGDTHVILLARRCARPRRLQWVPALRPCQGSGGALPADLARERIRQSGGVHRATGTMQPEPQLASDPRIPAGHGPGMD